MTDRIGLGVLTRVVGRDLVDEVLAQTGRVERRRRLLPARVVVYFVLAMTLFFDDAYEEVMRKLVGGLRVLCSWDEDWQVPSSPALCKARARLGEEPVRELFRRVAVPLAGVGCAGVWLGGLRVMAIDGVMMDIADTDANVAEFGRSRRVLADPYPKVKIVGLAECGTRAIVAAQIGAGNLDERALTRELLEWFEPGMVVLADRGFFSHQLWREATESGAQLLWRVQSRLKLPVVRPLADGSYISRLSDETERRHSRYLRTLGADTEPQGVAVRVVEYTITNRDSDQTGPIRLITTILDPGQASAAELAAAYHHRWEFETALAEIQTRQRGSWRVLRSQSPQLVRQEIWAMLITHYAIRELIYHAAGSEATDPLRLSFIRTLRIVRRHITGQAGFSP